MNSYDRLFNRIAGNPVDRVPNNCIVMGFAARYAGYSYREFVTNPVALSDAMIRCHEDFGIDIISAISDPMREAEGYGTKVIFPENSVPYASELLISDIADIAKLEIPIPENNRRMNDRLISIARMHEYSRKTCAVQGWVEGAFAEACDLIGLSEMMILIIEDPDAAKELLEICTEGAVRFALSQIKAGADIIGIGDAAASLIGPEMYAEFALPYEARIIREINRLDRKTRLHICGDIGKILGSVMKTGADIVDCDWMVDFSEAAKTFGHQCCACGNFDPVAIALESDVHGVSEAMRKCLNVPSDKTIIAAGCEIPIDTPQANMKAVTETIIRFSGRLDQDSGIAHV